MPKGKRAKAEASAAVSPELRVEVEQAFKLFDQQNDGSIDGKDVKLAMRALGLEPRKEEVARLTADMAPDENGRIPLERFVAVAAPRLAERSSRAEMQRAFRLFDADESGAIRFADLKRVANELGETISDDELREMIAEADSSGEGTVSAEDFYKIMKKTCLY